MKKYSILFAFCLGLIFAQSAFGQSEWDKWKVYKNARFGYSISYSSDLLLARGEADNGDGQIFSNNAAEMRVFGSYKLLNETLKKEFAAVVRESKNVHYKTFRKDFFAVSGTRDGRIFYQKTIAKPDGAFVTFYIEYAPNERADYDRITAKIVKSLK
jgi:hypothetical protein